MKRSAPLKQRTPLKPGKGFGPRSEPMARTSTLSTSKPLQRGNSQLARTPFQRKPPDPAQPPRKRTTRGMKGRTPTAAERAFMDAAGALPCLACLIDGRENHHISLHHIQGRTAPGAHFLTLPLCAQHHMQDDSDPLGRVSVHGRKATFTARYGTELELLARLRALLGM
jgi:hypothetical protein